MKASIIIALLLIGFTFTILVLNTKHRNEIDNIKEQIKACDVIGTVHFPDGEYFVVRYYSKEYYIY